MDKFDVLRKYFGYSSFRKGQEEMVDCLLSGRDALGIMPTGAGKSICYQVPAIMFGGVTIVVSPLISLMKDQVNALVQQGVKAAYINSSLTDTQYDKVLKNAALGIYKIIYVAPERLESVSFINLCRRIKISMVAVDESHCVSQWGQDFRPSYLNINKFISMLPNRPIIGAFTATATDEVKKDIINILQLEDPAVVTTGFDRPNLFFSVLRPAKKDSRLIELIKERRDKSGIIYCSTRKKVESVCDLLIKNGFPATRYHAGLSDEERVKNQDDFVYDRKPVMVATNAFGMGIDKSNVSYVIHYNMPKNIESYYQEAGRAGRDGQEADCILLYGAGDVQTCRYFIENTEPNPQLTPEQNEMFKKREEERLKHMIFYCRTSDCLRNYMLRYFGDEAEDNCGKCSNCLTKFETVDVTIEAQKVLSCIIRTGQKFGATMMVDVLRGKINDRITYFGLDKQSTFGIMKDSKPTEIKYIIEKLEEQGYIISVGAGKPILRVTEMSYPVLKGKAKVKVKKTVRIKSKEKTVEETVDIPLFNILKKIRYEIASKKGVPAFLIFSDASLTDMCRKLPVTPEEFLSVNGVGDNKLKQYGDRFISAIAEYKATGVENTDEQDSQNNIEKTQESEVNYAYKPWSEKEVEKLRFEYEAGISIDKIAKNHGRTNEDVRSRLKKEGLIEE